MEANSGVVAAIAAALACELGTSHQLLSFYLKGLGKWQGEEYWRRATEIRARAIAEGRPLTQWEEQQVNAYTRAAIRAMVTPVLLDTIERMKEESERGPLCATSPMVLPTQV